MSSVLENDDLGSLSMKVCWSLFGVATVTFVLRVYCRLHYNPRQGGGLYMDDFMTLACVAVVGVFSLLLTLALPSGVGRHYNTLSSAQKVDSVRWNAILSAVTPWLCTLPKFAIIMTLRRILYDCSTRTIAMFWGLALASQATAIALVLVGLFQCAPVSYQWTRSGEGTCWDPSIYTNLAYFVYAFSTALDVFYAVYPVPFVMRLKMPLKTRLGVACSLSVGLVGFIISIYKFSMFPILGPLIGTDPSYSTVFLSMSHAAEGSTLIISTSLVTLRPLFRGIRQHVTELSMATVAASSTRRRPFSTSARKSVGAPALVGSAYLATCTRDDDTPLTGGFAEHQNQQQQQQQQNVCLGCGNITSTSLRDRRSSDGGSGSGLVCHECEGVIMVQKTVEVSESTVKYAL